MCHIFKDMYSSCNFCLLSAVRDSAESRIMYGCIAEWQVKRRGTVFIMYKIKKILAKGDCGDTETVTFVCFYMQKRISNSFYNFVFYTFVFMCFVFYNSKFIQFTFYTFVFYTGRFLYGSLFIRFTIYN